MSNDKNLPRSCKEFLLRYAEGERDFSSINLSGADLAGQSIVGVNFTDAKLQDCNISNADLSHSQLCGLLLVGYPVDYLEKLDKNELTDLMRKGADLRNANLEGVNLTGADLRKAILVGTCLEGANLTDAQLIKADFSSIGHVFARKGTSLANTNLSGADLTHIYGWGINLKGAIIDDKTQMDRKLLLAHGIINKNEGKDAILIKEDLSGLCLEEANLKEADLTHSSLEGAFLANANLEGADLSRANVKFADFTGANLCGANLLTVVNLDRAILSNIIHDAKTRFPKKFNIEKLKGNIVSATNHYQEKKIVWGNMQFQSQAQLELAKALEREGIIYSPCPMISVVTNRIELDFLVFYRSRTLLVRIQQDKWTKDDLINKQENDNVMRQNGFQFYNVKEDECLKFPDKLAREILHCLVN